jgi:hypothetical protein
MKVERQAVQVLVVLRQVKQEVEQAMQIAEMEAYPVGQVDKHVCGGFRE